MENFKFLIKDNLLSITIDLAHDCGFSKSGRSRIVSTTGGNLRLFDENGFRSEKINMTISKEIPEP
jgi:hypothetical protein